MARALFRRRRLCDLCFWSGVDCGCVAVEDASSFFSIKFDCFLMGACDGSLGNRCRHTIIVVALIVSTAQWWWNFTNRSMTVLFEGVVDRILVKLMDIYFERTVKIAHAIIRWINNQEHPAPHKHDRTNIKGNNIDLPINSPRTSVGRQSVYDLLSQLVVDFDIRQKH